MNIYQSLFSPSFVLNEQIARQIFEVLPEEGIIMLIKDRNGNSWPSDSEGFASLNITESFMDNICSQIDDGVEPVISKINNCSIIATQLTTEQNHCGYVILALPGYDSKLTVQNINLIEMILSQISLIAQLLEKNNRLYEAKVHNLKAAKLTELNPN